MSIDKFMADDLDKQIEEIKKQNARARYINVDAFLASIVMHPRYYGIKRDIEEFPTSDVVPKRKAKAEAYEEFAERVKRCILERDDETIDCIKENLIKELREELK